MAKGQKKTDAAADNKPKRGKRGADENKNAGGAPENKKGGRKSPTQEAAAAFRFTVKDLADKLGIQDTSARVQLRNKGIAKNGAVYGWNTEKEMEAVIAQLRGDEKPAGKASDKKSSKKSGK